MTREQYKDNPYFFVQDVLDPIWIVRIIVTVNRQQHLMRASEAEPVENLDILRSLFEQTQGVTHNVADLVNPIGYTLFAQIVGRDVRRAKQSDG